MEIPGLEVLRSREFTVRITSAIKKLTKELEKPLKFSLATL